MITRVVTQNVCVEGEWEKEAYETDVICPNCGSEDVWFADEPQPCDGVELYDGLTYSIVCNQCKHLFYEQEFLDVTLKW